MEMDNVGKDRWGKGTKKKGNERENEQANTSKKKVQNMHRLEGKKVQRCTFFKGTNAMIAPPPSPISLWECTLKGI